jgi:protein-S-isoprenylcysteine O-methyltransferase Ste14
MNYLRAFVYFLSTLAMYLGVSLLAWGIDDLQSFFSIAPRSVYAAVVLAFSLAIGYQAINAPEGISGSKGEKSKLVRRQTLVGLVMVACVFGLLVFLPLADRRSIGVMVDGEAIRWAGCVLCCLGYALVFWSGLALGKQYSAEVTIQKDHQLITTGLYHTIRHPRYLGLISLGIGTACVFHSWIGLGTSILLLGVLWLRIKDEEALLHREFGAAWEVYCQHSWRLIPFLY